MPGRSYPARRRRAVFPKMKKREEKSQKAKWNKKIQIKRSGKCSAHFFFAESPDRLVEAFVLTCELKIDFHDKRSVLSV